MTWRSWILLTCCAGCFVAKDMPRAGIVVPQSTRARTFVFYICPDRTRAPSISVVTIKSVDDNVVACELVRRNPAATLAEWRLGDVPAGFETVGACDSLQLGRRYELSVVGSASGRREFRLNERGHIVLAAEDSCH